MQYVNRISACRRGLNSPTAASPLKAAGVGTAPSCPKRVRKMTTRSAAPHERLTLKVGTAVGEAEESSQTCFAPASSRSASSGHESIDRAVRATRARASLPLTPSAASRSRVPASTARSGKQPTSRARVTKTYWAKATSPTGTPLPNPSLKRSANGRPPGPGLWPTGHFHSPGPGVPPLAPA